jgi:MOSC domain-containing protein YiiM
MEMKDLLNCDYKGGQVVYIGLRPERRAEVVSVPEVEAIAGIGLAGDRYKSKGGSRQVTLIQEEHIHAVASFLEKDEIDPGLLRRNIVVKGFNLLTLKGKQFRVGDAVLQYSGECHPCSRMEEVLGKGGYNAMRGHGGITARIVKTGLIRLNALVQPIYESQSNESKEIF